MGSVGNTRFQKSVKAGITPDQSRRRRFWLSSRNFTSPTRRNGNPFGQGVKVALLNPTWFDWLQCRRAITIYDETGDGCFDWRCLEWRRLICMPESSPVYTRGVKAKGYRLWLSTVFAEVGKKSLVKVGRRINILRRGGDLLFGFWATL